MIKPITAAATALLATSALAQDQQRSQNAGADPEARDLAMQRESQVLNLMRLSNQAEIQAAELVLERTGDEAVRRFADRLLRDHQLADSMLNSLAESKGIALTTADLDEGAPPLTGAPPALPRSDDHSADPLEYEATPASLNLPQISEPPSAQQVRQQQPQSPRAGETQEQTGAYRGDIQTPAVQAPGAGQVEAPPPVPGQTPRQPRNPGLKEDPPPAAQDHARESPLDLRIAHRKAQRMLRELESADDASLNAAYAAAMIKSHDQTVQNLRAGLQAVSDPDVEDLLQRLIPILEQHARLARHVQRELGGQRLDIEQEGS